jgi:hypothetical protein
MGVSGGAMQDLGYELPRIHIPRTPVNKQGEGALLAPPVVNVLRGRREGLFVGGAG